MMIGQFICFLENGYILLRGASYAIEFLRSCIKTNQFRSCHFLPHTIEHLGFVQQLLI